MKTIDKTVLDAVIYFHGVAKHYDQCNPNWFNFVGHQDKGGFYLLQNKSKFTICTREEFNTYVEHLASNMGRAKQTYAEYKKEFNYMTTPTKPVYTQEMCDAGELPSVGMECLVLNTCMAHPTYEKCSMLFSGEFGVVYNSESCKERYARNDVVKFKPLPIPVELIDGEAYKFKNRNIQTICGIYNEDRNIFSVEQGQWFDVIAVTNIKHLTVKESD